MPNIFFNTLRIYSTSLDDDSTLKLIDKFILENSSKIPNDNDCVSLDFNSSVPQPQEVLNNLSEFYSIEQILNPNNPLNWCTLNWGTKWNPKNVKIKKFEDSVIYYFETASGPPLPWLKTTSKKYSQMFFEINFIDEFRNNKGNFFYNDGNQYKLKNSSANEKKN